MRQTSESRLVLLEIWLTFQETHLKNGNLTVIQFILYRKWKQTDCSGEVKLFLVLSKEIHFSCELLNCFIQWMPFFFWHHDNGQEMRFYENPHSVTPKLTLVMAVLWMPTSGNQVQSSWPVSLNLGIDSEVLEKERDYVCFRQSIVLFLSIRWALINTGLIKVDKTVSSELSFCAMARNCSILGCQLNFDRLP